jgi:hypothetical protein
MYKYNDLTGKKYGRLTVVGQYGRSKDRHILWKCVCDCGHEAIVAGRDLTSGHSKSCGCLQKETTHTIRYKHGDRDARLYSVWKSMKKRCENKRCKSYHWYGAKGVSVCTEWMEYKTFKEWALANGYDSLAPFGECTIDRIDPYGNYEPSNCRWISMSEQSKNKRKSVEQEG